jgi:hypothetical protein
MADEHYGGFVAYYRVSTAQQGKGGLGTEAQQAAVKSYLNGGRWNLVHRFDEIDHMGVGFIFAETTCSLTA